MSIQLGRAPVASMAATLRAMADNELVAVAFPALRDMLSGSAQSVEVAPLPRGDWDDEKPALKTPGHLLTEQVAGQRVVQVIKRDGRMVPKDAPAAVPAAPVRAESPRMPRYRRRVRSSGKDVERRVVDAAEFVQAHPGCARGHVAQALKINPQLATNALASAKLLGLVEMRGERGEARWYPKGEVAE